MKPHEIKLASGAHERRFDDQGRFTGCAQESLNG